MTRLPNPSHIPAIPGRPQSPAISELAHSPAGVRPPHRPAGPPPHSPPARADWPWVFRRLARRFGPQRWWPADSLWELAAGAVLVQGTSWTGAQRALAALRVAHLDTPTRLLAAETTAVEAAVRPSGYYRAKARKLLALAEQVERAGGLYAWLDASHRLSDAALRRRLLAVPGIGPETADCLLVYAADRPAFVADAYARRVARRLADAPVEPGYAALQTEVTTTRPGTALAWGERHALLVELGKRHCRRTHPRCAPGRISGGAPPAPAASTECPLLVRCRFGQRVVSERLIAASEPGHRCASR